MKSKARSQRVTDLPPSKRHISILNSYEVSKDSIRVAALLADTDLQIGELAILDISMHSMAVRVEDVIDDVCDSFYSYQGEMDIATSGHVVHLRRGKNWETFPLRKGLLFDAFSLDGKVIFVCGEKGQIFRFDESSMGAAEQVDSTDRLFAIHGVSKHRLYAVGRNGTLLKANGQKWEKLNIDATTDFRCIYVSQERIYVGGDGGRAGMVLDGGYSGFETGKVRDVLSVCSFKDEIYFCDSDFGVHHLVDGTFKPIANLGYTYRLHGGKHQLTATCGEYVFQFDGKTWRGIEISYDKGYKVAPYDMSFMG